MKTFGLTRFLLFGTIFSILLVKVLPFAPVEAQSAKPILGAHYPAISPDGQRVAFSYLGDLWTVPITGGEAKRVTVHVAHDTRPRFSPDGKWLAFSSNREGHYDVYVLPAQGGTPKRLTFHSSDDLVQDWSPDGREVVFLSNRQERFLAPFGVEVQTGVVRRLARDHWGQHTAVKLLPDGQGLLLTRGATSWWRKAYKGAANLDLWHYDRRMKQYRRLTDSPENELWAMPSPDGKIVYFVAERNGVKNLYKMALAGGRMTPLTSYKQDAVIYPDIARQTGRIVYEWNSRLWFIDPQKPEPTEIVIYAPSDEKVNTRRRMNYNRHATEIEPSPDGKQIAFAVKGEIFLVETEKGGDAKRLTESLAVREGDFWWSPDGKRLAFVSNATGNEQIYTIEIETKKIKRLTQSAYNDTTPQYSPDGKWIAFKRGPFGLGLYLIPAEGGAERALVTDPEIGDFRWSPDSKWIAYNRRDPTSTWDIWIVNIQTGEKHNVTRYPGWNGNPQWTQDGKYLLFASNRGENTQIYVLPLRLEEEVEDKSAGERPARQRVRPDEGILPDDTLIDEQPQTPKKEEGETKQEKPSEEKKPVEVQIDWMDIHKRAKAITSVINTRGTFGVAPDSKTVYFVASPLGTPDIWKVNVDGTGQTQVTRSGESPAGFRFSPDGAKVFYLADGQLKYLSGGNVHSIAYTAAMDWDAREEIRGMFEEAWWGLKMHFYDEKMHGVDWEAVRKRYEPLLEHVVTKEDFYFLVTQMIGELKASHLGIWGSTETRETAYLGIQLDEEYTGKGARITEILPLSPAAKLAEPLKAGEYILAVDEEEVRHTEHLYELLTNKVGKIVQLKVHSKPVLEGARRVKLKAISRNEHFDLWYDRWVEKTRQTVELLSKGRLGYHHIRAMDRESLERFQREIFGELQAKEGLILDVRFNGGGRIHDDLLMMLNRKVHAFEKRRWHPDYSTQPFQLWDRPTVLLMNEFSFSDAEIFPNGFRTYGFGPLLGLPTAGGVIGTITTTLIDGETSFRYPVTGWWTLDGTNLENTGVAPDQLVPITPEAMVTGEDPQLEAAVQEALKRLERHPPAPRRPAARLKDRPKPA